MAFPQFNDRVWETSTTTGTGNITLLGAVAGFRSFSAAYLTGERLSYVIEGVNVSSEWETGWGTWNGSVLVRDTAQSSSTGGAKVSFTAGTKNVFVDAIGVDLQPLNNYLYVQAQFGAAGDGATDDTAAVNAAIAAVAADRGQTLVFEPGVYLCPNGITESKTGLVCVGLGHIGVGPGGQHSSMGAIIKSTGTGVYNWTKTATGNEYRGGRMENMGFWGDADTAGGLFIKTCFCLISNCVAADHYTGSGFKGDIPSGGDSAALNRYNSCISSSCLNGWEMVPGGAIYAHLIDCIAVKYSYSGIYHTGYGVKCSDSTTIIIGGHFESHAVGVLSSWTNLNIIGATFEDNLTWDINLDRGSGSSGTRNLVVASTTKINIGAFNVEDVIIGGNSVTAVDAGDTTMMFGHGILKAARTSGTPTGGFSGEIRVGSAKIWVNDNGTWKSATVA